MALHVGSGTVPAEQKYYRVFLAAVILQATDTSAVGVSSVAIAGDAWAASVAPDVVEAIATVRWASSCLECTASSVVVQCQLAATASYTYMQLQLRSSSAAGPTTSQHD